MKKGESFLLLIIKLSILLLYGMNIGCIDESIGLLSNTIKVGVISDITGPTAQLQTPLHKGINTYLTHINDTGGIHGRKFKVIIKDGRYNVARDIANFKDLVYRNKIFMLFEIGSTGSGMALIYKVSREQVPTMMTSTTDFFIHPTQPYHFTEGATYEDEIKILLHYIIDILKEKNIKLALVRANTQHGKVGAKTFREQLNIYGLQSSGEEVISPGGTEASSQIINLKRNDVTHVILHTTEGNAATFMKEANRYKFYPKIYGTKYACSEDTLRIVKNAARNFYATNSFSSWYDKSSGIQNMRRITLKYHAKSSNHIYYRHYTQGWCQGIIAVEALKRTGEKLNRSGLLKAWESINNFNMGGLMANVTYGPSKHQGSEYCKIYKADVDNLIFMPITKYIKAEREF